MRSRHTDTNSNYHTQKHLHTHCVDTHTYSLYLGMSLTDTPTRMFATRVLIRVSRTNNTDLTPLVMLMGQFSTKVRILNSFTIYNQRSEILEVRIVLKWPECHLKSILYTDYKAYYPQLINRFLAFESLLNKCPMYFCQQ